MREKWTKTAITSGVETCKTNRSDPNVAVGVLWLQSADQAFLESNCDAKNGYHNGGNLHRNRDHLQGNSLRDLTSIAKVNLQHVT